jgi:LacI family transcriptional regulator
MNRPTQADVAKLAGVSRTTVSFVINEQAGGNIRISDETRQRVWAAVEELGYQPNVAAQSLRTRRTQLIALMVPDLTNPFYPTLIRGAQSVADTHDYQMLVYDSDDTPSRERAFVDVILRRRVDGTIMLSFHLGKSDVIRIIKAGIEVVDGIGIFGASEVDTVITDEHQAVHKIMQHLIDKGHKRIAHLAGIKETPPGKIRFEAYCESLISAGLPYDPSLVRFGTFRQEGVAEHINALLAQFPPPNHPTAIFAANDVMAIEAVRTLTDLGQRIPEDIAVCGFDDIPQAEWIKPSLTTVRQDPYELGRQAANLLFKRLHSDEASQVRQLFVPYQLVIREST